MADVKIFVGGKDRSGDLGTNLVAAAAERARGPGPRLLYHDHSALTLKQAVTEAEYLVRYQQLLSMRHGVNPSFVMPRRPGFAGLLAARLRDWIWRQVHHRIARIVDQQNGINELVVFGLTLQNQALREELDRVRSACAVPTPGASSEPVP